MGAGVRAGVRAGVGRSTLPTEAAGCEAADWGPQRRVQSVPRGRRSHVAVLLSRPRPLRGADGGGPAWPSKLSRMEALRGTVPWGCRETGPLVSPPHAASPGDGARAPQSGGTGEGGWVHT